MCALATQLPKDLPLILLVDNITKEDSANLMLRGHLTACIPTPSGICQWLFAEPLTSDHCVMSGTVRSGSYDDCGRSIAPWLET